MKLASPSRAILLFIVAALATRALAVEDAHTPTVPVDQVKFGSVYQAATAVAAATNDSKVTRALMKDLVETLRMEVSVAKPQAKTPQEVQMVNLYSDALVAYGDGLQFWELRRFTDRQGQSDSLDALAVKYGIQPRTNVSYGAAWQSYPNAPGKIWAVGNAATAKATSLYDK